MIAPTEAYYTRPTDTLADLRRHVSLYPEAVYLDPGELANRLGYPTAEVAAALEALCVEGEVLV